MDHQRLRSADILSGIVFIMIGIGVCIYSFDMILKNPDPQNRFYTSAGFIPCIFGVLLILASTVVLLNGIHEGGSLKLFRPSVLWSGLKSDLGLTILFIYGWIAAYIFILLRILPYFISALLFMVVFMFRFYSKRPVLVLTVSVIVSALVSYIFGSVINIPLPGM